ncbi:uncharacterized protein JCM6883_003089 [Sporobolomyces salmoneus]|uniref:uncharacterized protein n=1 Tax=Sporobolomyces salmoneus TaxID=183962 RepID=UPI003180C649
MKGLLGLYLLSLIVALTSLALSLSSFLHPTWIFTRPLAKTPIELTTKIEYGLFESCTTTSYVSQVNGSEGGLGKRECRKFPVRGIDCGAKKESRNKQKKRISGSKIELFEHDTARDESFCDRWLLAGYAHQLSLIFSLTSLLSLSLTLLGTLRAGRGYRTERLRGGWKLVVGLMGFQFGCEAVSWGVVRWEYENESLFQGGSKALGRGFVESVTTFSLLGATILAILFVRVTQRLRIVPEAAAREDGYESIRD